MEKKEKLGLLGVEPPDAFLCPITYDLMKDPVVASDGHTYERDALTHWFTQACRASAPLHLPTPQRSSILLRCPGWLSNPSAFF